MSQEKAGERTIYSLQLGPGRMRVAEGAGLGEMLSLDAGALSGRKAKQMVLWASAIFPLVGLTQAICAWSK